MNIEVLVVAPVFSPRRRQCVVVLGTPPLEDGDLPEIVRDRFAFPIVHVVIETEVLHAAA